ncbi:GWxTD domain-containing protein [Hymenobacter caeli]|uniref:GWxTD domain-containing protein n=1 Tax=Hymenobacter caeli TaxID=2735894 RepID=A0ABX2FUF8_9BACT|nr:GWxTD domain-containing protein [Hymenobacter caeli]NRT20774.1 GWxTD domain-containing protein [Hymenobacter caeli]
MNRFFFWLVLAALPGRAAVAQTQALPLPRPNFAGLYRDVPRVMADTRREGDSLRLYVRLPAGAPTGPGQPMRVTAWAGYEAPAPLWQDSIPRRRQHLRPDATGGTRASFCVAAARVPAGTVLQVQIGPVAPPTAQDAATTTWLVLSAERLARPFVITDSVGLPLLRPYVRARETFRIDNYGLVQPVRLRRYAVPPTAALPPMTDPATVAGGPATLPLIDSVNVRSNQLLRCDDPSLMALHVGGIGGQVPRTLALLVANGDYPNLRTAAELIDPLRYLTSTAERQRLANAPDPKRAVDGFWLTAAHENQSVGKVLIRNYYGRVAAANRLFPAHKAGFLTDRGLLYVVLGPPQRVQRLATGDEQWYYAQVGPGGPLTFSFRPRPSTFAPDNYELVRRPEYEKPWYGAVEQWRTGQTAPSAPATDPSGR